MKSAKQRYTGAQPEIGAISPRGYDPEGGVSALGACPDSPWEAMQGRVELCKRCMARGFTLLELMAVMVMLTVVAAATFSGIGGHTFDSAHRRFLDDVYGLIVQARNRAIEDQTEVVVRMESSYIAMRVVDPFTHVESEWMRFDLRRLYGRSLDGHTCFLGVFAGVTAPGMTSPVVAAPESCMSGQQDFSFLPDGTFSSRAVMGPGQGLTLVSADMRIPTRPKYAIIELFPGGAMRRIDNVTVSH